MAAYSSQTNRYFIVHLRKGLFLHNLTATRTHIHNDWHRVSHRAAPLDRELLKLCALLNGTMARDGTWARGEPLLPRDRLPCHAHGPLAVHAHLHVPGVSSGVEALGTQDTLIVTEPLWVVRESLLLLCVPQAGQIIRQRQADISRVGVKSHRSWM